MGVQVHSSHAVWCPCPGPETTGDHNDGGRSQKGYLALCGQVELKYCQIQFRELEAAHAGKAAIHGNHTKGLRWISSDRQQPTVTETLRGAGWLLEPIHSCSLIK